MEYIDSIEVDENTIFTISNCPLVGVLCIENNAEGKPVLYVVVNDGYTPSNIIITPLRLKQKIELVDNDMSFIGKTNNGTEDIFWFVQDNPND